MEMAQVPIRIRTGYLGIKLRWASNAALSACLKLALSCLPWGFDKFGNTPGALCRKV